ncbi:hypothetical protein ACHAXA_009433 [Cyclostephanos tholiformis]|uniref:Mitochondrial carrier protein n=1 Tax=Cyclostephanos tholiformis TaxID=382380 RepID=A0ABD3RGU6_9STRA
MTTTTSTIITPPLSTLLAGIAGGSASTVLLYPLDLIKVRMQVDEGSHRRVVAASAAVDRRRRRRPSPPVAIANAIVDPPLPPPSPTVPSSYRRDGTSTSTSSSTTTTTRNTICHTVRGVIRHEGYVGLYRGLVPAVIGSATSWGGFFILYEDIKGRMIRRREMQRLEEGGEGGGEGEGEEEDVTSSSGSTTAIGGGEMQRRRTTATTTTTTTTATRLGPLEHFAASCLAGACMVALTNPLWLIKTRMQLQNTRLLQNRLSSHSPPGATVAIAHDAMATMTTTTGQQRTRTPYRGLFHAAYTIAREEGMMAFYRGSVPALMLVSHGGIQFMTYEFMKGRFANYVSDGKKNDIIDIRQSKDGCVDGGGKGTIGERLRDSLGYLVMGAMSKIVASTATYPLQVMKARLQQRSQAIEISETTGEIVITKREYTGVIDCTKKIWRNEGIYGFFKGCVTNAIRVAPSAAVTFVTYEFVLDALTEIS